MSINTRFFWSCKETSCPSLHFGWNTNITDKLIRIMPKVYFLASIRLANIDQIWILTDVRLHEELLRLKKTILILVTTLCRPINSIDCRAGKMTMRRIMANILFVIVMVRPYIGPKRSNAKLRVALLLFRFDIVIGPLTET